MRSRRMQTKCFCGKDAVDYYWPQCSSSCAETASDVSRLDRDDQEDFYRDQRENDR
jgi:hypothetical protein